MLFSSYPEDGLYFSEMKEIGLPVFFIPELKTSSFLPLLIVLPCLPLGGFHHRWFKRPLRVRDFSPHWSLESLSVYIPVHMYERMCATSSLIPQIVLTTALCPHSFVNTHLKNDIAS